jgi:hypothetical protein
MFFTCIDYTEMAERTILNDELGIMWNDVVTFFLKIISKICMEGLGETTETTFRMSCCQARI